MIFNRDEEFKFSNVHISDLAFNYEPLCKAFTESYMEVNDQVIDSARMFARSANAISGEDISPFQVINDFLNRV